MNLYNVYKTGIYRHECVGVFSTLELATAAAKTAAENEPDQYHSFEIYLYELDKIATLNAEPKLTYGKDTVHEDAPLLTITKADL